MRPARGVVWSVAFLVLAVCAGSLRAQDRRVIFDTGGPGESKAIEEWGLDTTWPSLDNMRRGLIYMGEGQVDFVRVAFPVDEPLEGGELGSAGLAGVDARVALANLAGVGVPLVMTPDTEAGVHPSFKNGAQVIPGAWVAAMEAAVRAYESRGRVVVSASPFNEPDYSGWNQGTMANLYDICVLLGGSPTFADIALAGGSTLNCDAADGWYNPIRSLVEAGTTHQLAGSFDGYAGFLQNVRAGGDKAVNDEAHNVCEVIVGAEYGLQAASWWGSAERARAGFVEACQGERLGYAEHRPNWTAAAVYRAPGGGVRAFVGASERQAVTTGYRFFARDRDVFYDGHGPMRAYTVTIPGGSGYWVDQPNAERLVEITWGADVQPVIDGRYIVVARHSGLAMEVVSASTGNGANIRQSAYGGGAHQHWDIVPLDSRRGGDYSYFAITAAHSGKAADLFSFAYDDGGQVGQWDDLSGVNQHWFLEYVEDGWFHIRNRWSGKVLDVDGASPATGANIRQWSGTGGLNQQWRLIPAGNPVEFEAPGAPAGVRAAAQARSVRLDWDANPEPDLYGYTVLRATNPGGPYDIVARDLRDPGYTDNAANRPQPYFYVVRAMDGSLNRSPPSAEVSAAPTQMPALVAHYAFDENLEDRSVNANHVIVAEGAPAFVAGRHGQALDLDGAGQYVMLPATLLAGVRDFTIAVWVNWDGGDAWQRIFDWGNDTAEYMFLTPGSGAGTLRFAVAAGGAGAEQILETAALPVGVWRHVAVTRAGDTARLYVNGALADTGAVTIAPADVDPALNSLGDSQFDADPFFNGRLDELFLYNYALEEDAILSLMNNQPPPPPVPVRLSASRSGNSLQVSWPMDHLGSRLEANAAGLSSTGAWTPVSGSEQTNQIAVPMDAAGTSVYFRLVDP